MTGNLIGDSDGLSLGFQAQCAWRHVTDRTHAIFSQ